MKNKTLIRTCTFESFFFPFLIAISMGCNSIESGIDKFDKLLSGLEISAPTVESDSDFDLLKKSVNPVRLKNNPVELTEEAINNIYHTILRK